MLCEIVNLQWAGISESVGRHHQSFSDILLHLKDVILSIPISTPPAQQ